ncbi:MAG: hypothetical protein WCK49_03855 [Myxococcaceae bacterium]
MQVGTSLRPVYKPEPLPVLTHIPENLVLDVCHQFQDDHGHHPQGPNLIVYGMSQVLGQMLTRRFSNLLSCAGLGQFLPAQREYSVLQPWDELATRFQPKIFTISENQSKDPGLKPNQLRYEILPPQKDSNCYSIIYFLGLPTEKLPVPILGTLYDCVRPVLFGSKHDWEAIQIDIDRDTMEPVGMSFETCNYSNAPDTYDLISRKDLHLFTKISKTPNGTWKREIQQKNGTIQTTEVQNPFRDSTHANMAVVSWNTSLDLCDQVAQNSNLKLYPVDMPDTQFMDMDTYRKEGIDLRAAWLEKRRLGKFILKLPARSVANST